MPLQCPSGVRGNSTSRDLTGVWQPGNAVILEWTWMKVSQLFLFSVFCSPHPLDRLLTPKALGYAGHCGGAGGKEAPLPGFPCQSIQVQEHKDLLFFLFHLISVQRLCLISYPCLKCGINLLLLLSQHKGAPKLFWFSLTRITLCWGSWLWDGAALATYSAK